jgi:hypothetical protein
MSKVNPLVPTNRLRKIHVDLNTSNIADPDAIMAAVSHLSRSCYTRYGSTIDFYIPANEVDYWVNQAEAHGLNVVS